MAHELSGHMIDEWSGNSRHSGESASDAAAILNMLRRLDDIERIDHFLESVCARGGFGKGDVSAVALALKLLPRHRSAELLHSIVASNATLGFQACAGLLDQVAADHGIGDLTPAGSALVPALPGGPPS